LFSTLISSFSVEIKDEKPSIPLIEGQFPSAAPIISERTPVDLI
jgi:hypothetical protein